MPGQKFYDFAEVEAEIVRETERATGRNKGVSRKPINLKISSPHVLNLTLVDLPGMTKVSVGDQPVDIEDQIRGMCLSFISNPNAIILAVTAGNSDLANSDALKLAKEADPEGERTIGVLTKLDLMDPGTDASDMLQNRVIPLRRGYVGVVNRGQRDVASKTSVSAALKREQQFFKGHTAYRAMLNRCSTPTLSRMLNQILMHHIRDCLPDIKSRITGMMLDVNAEIDALGVPAEALNLAHLGGILLSLLSNYAANFGNAVEGKGSLADTGIEMNELFGGARISYIFTEIFGRSILSMNPFDGLSDDDIRTAICNANGTRQSLFVPEISFDLLVRRQIARLEQPGLQCIDLVFDELQRMASQCETTELTRFPELRDRVLDVVNALLRKCVGPTQAMISNLIKIELAYINTSHPDFIGGSRAVAQLMDRVQQQSLASGGRPTPSATQPRAQEASQRAVPPRAETSEEGKEGGGLLGFFGLGKDKRAAAAKDTVVKLPQVPETMRRPADAPTDRERIETEIIKSLIESYFDIVRKNFMDMVPKSIMHFLVSTAKEGLQNDLVSQLYKDSSIGEMMKETPDVARRRSEIQEMRALLQKALEIVNEVRDFNAFVPTP
jgi:dynamin 1-like protein